MRLITITLIALIPFIGFSQSKEINFTDKSWDDILAMAKEQNKPVFLDAYASWCGPCKWMAKNVFTDDKVADYYNENFITAKIDMEKGEGLEIASRYAVRNYPTLIYVDGDGKLIHRVCGSMKADKFIDQGEVARTGEKSLAYYKKSFDEGNRDSEMVKTYLDMRGKACMSTDEVVTKYFKGLDGTTMATKENWELIDKYLDTQFSPVFQTVVDNKAGFIKAGIEAKVVDAKLLSIYESDLRAKTIDYVRLKRALAKTGIEGADATGLKADLLFYQYTGANEAYASTAVKLMESTDVTDSRFLNQVAWAFYENVDDPKLLSKAADWAKKSIEIESGYANNDTYAAILFKLKRKDEALKAAENAIQLAKDNDQDYSGTEALLEKINAL